MKKLIFSTLLAAAVASATCSAEDLSILFTHADDVKTAFKLTSQKDTEDGRSVVGDRVYCAMQIPNENVALYSGAEITEVQFYTGLYFTGSGQYEVPRYKQVEIFVTNNLDGSPITTQTVNVAEEVLGLNTVKLNTPVKLQSGTPIYVGYSLEIADENDFYFPVDAEKNSLGISCYTRRIRRDGVEDELSAKYLQRSNNQGNLCIAARLEGASLPRNGVIVTGSKAPVAGNTEEPFSVLVNVKGTGAIPAENVTFDYTIGNVTGSYTGKVLDPETLEPSPIAYDGEGVVKIENITYTVPTLSATLTFTGRKVNGSDNVTTTNAYGALFFPCYAFSKGYERYPILEEATSVSCAWCPAGAALADYYTETYGAKLPCVAYHLNYGSTRDQMTSETGVKWPDYYASSYPYGLLNRKSNTMLGRLSSLQKLVDNSQPYVDEIMNTPGYVGLDLKAEYTDESKSALKVDATVSIALNNPGMDRWKLSFVLTEDNVGPYRQENAYAGSTEEMGGWEDRGSRVKTTFNHVARDLFGFPGIDNSIPSDLKTGESHTYTTELSLANVQTRDFHLIAMVTDEYNGEVLNARQIDFTDGGNDQNAIESIDSDAAVSVIAAEGCVLTTAPCALIEAYSIDGRLAGSAANATELRLPAGLYVIKADGTTAKVNVR